MRRALGAMLVAVLVVLAGCSGVFGGGGEPTETVTPAAVPTDEPTPTPVPQLAPGITGEGIENRGALLNAHGSLLQNTSFTTTSNTTTVAENGSVLVQWTSTLRAGPDGEGFYSVSERNGSYEYPTGAIPVRTEGWSDGERVFLQRTYANGTTTHERLRNDAEELRYNLAQGELQFRLESFGSNNTAVTERLSRNGSTLYRINGTSQPYGPDNTSLSVLADDRGVVHSYRTVQRPSFDENISHSVSTGRFFAIGSTDLPERPSWVDEAMNRTSAASGATETVEQQPLADGVTSKNTV
jgi:hypothetical protein